MIYLMVYVSIAIIMDDTLGAKIKGSPGFP